MKTLKSIITAIMLITAVGCGAKDNNNVPETAVETTTSNQTEAAAENGSSTDAAANTEAAVNVVGNSTSNYTNNGYATMYSDNIYFVGKDNGKKGIYKINNNTGVVEIVAEDSGQDLSTIDGTIYYLKEGSIYKASRSSLPEVVKQDGTITDMCANNSWIYYIKPDDKGLGKVYKIMFSGSGETMVTPRSDVTADIKTITYANSYLYFSDNSGIGRISLDGKNKSYVITGYQVNDYSVYGDYVYFVYQGQIFRIKIGEGASEAVSCNAANIQKINIVGDIIYLISDSGIGSVNVNGGTVTPISPEKPTDISVSGSYIFGTKGIYFYRMKTDGSDAVSF